MEQIASGQYDYTIHSYHTDLKGQVGLYDLFSFLQESAWKHAEVNDFGHEALIRENCFWALSRIKVKIAEYPRRGEKITLETWGKAPDGIMAYRDFEAFDLSGKKIISASSSWLIVDINTRRPRRTSIMNGKFCILHRDAMDSKPEKIDSKPSINDNAIAGTARYSDLDINGHVNNTCYVRWVSDSFPTDYLRQHDVSEIDMNFLHESTAGDNFKIHKEEIADNVYLCNIIRCDDGKELMRAVLKFGKRKQT